MLEKVQADRRSKLEQVRQLGVDPFGTRYDSAEPIADILARYQETDDGQPVPDQRADAAGRLVLARDMGKMIFAHVQDQTGRMQIAFRKNALDETGWALAKLLDLGDIIGVEGLLQKSRTGEITIWADRLVLLCKSLNPMPEKFHGLQNVEQRYRQRYLDLMTNRASLERFQLRTRILSRMRECLNGRDFCEVETPALQPIYGGAAARPFTTHHNALDADLFLRISPELYLKRLLVGGMERVYEFSRNFRNEGIDTSHNPEFTLLELYQAYADYEVMMEITEELIGTAAEELALPAVVAQADRLAGEDSELARARKALEEDPDDAEAARTVAHCETILAAAEKCRAGQPVLPYGQELIDFTRPWRRATYAELLREHAGVSIDDIQAVRAKAQSLGIDEAKLADAVVVNEVFEETVEAHLVQPTFVKDYPADLCPLTRRKADDPSTALRFECFIARMELGNAYTELNDPDVQQTNFTRQLAGEREDETMAVMDEDFVTALRHGMPPAGGLGIGVDRVVMLLTNTTSIRDVILFPQLRPEQKGPAGEKPAAGPEPQ